MKNHRFLCLTSFPFIYSSYIAVSKALKILYFLVFITSQLFWYTCRRHDYIHNIDQYVAKVTGLYTFYEMTRKDIFECIFFTVLIMSFFYMSHRNSSRQWVCNEHLFYHGCMHLSCISTVIWMKL